MGDTDLHVVRNPLTQVPRVWKRARATDRDLQK